MVAGEYLSRQGSVAQALSKVQNKRGELEVMRTNRGWMLLFVVESVQVQLLKNAGF